MDKKVIKAFHVDFCQKNNVMDTKFLSGNVFHLMPGFYNILFSLNKPPAPSLWQNPEF